jgi:glucan phosphoethanolaminetransferase (alkaline phosphatase superfamily)
MAVYSPPECLVSRRPAGSGSMIFKIMAFAAAAIPIFLFVRSMFFQRTARINDGLKEFKKQADLAVSIFLFLIGCVVVGAVGKLAWTWWTTF